MEMNNTRKKMKTSILLAVSILLIVCGCEKKECKELSWTGYNSVEDVHCNFKYFIEENKAHIGDSLKVFGWLFETHEYHPNWQYLTNKKEVQHTNNMSLLCANPHLSLFLPYKYLDSLMPSNPYDTLLYVTGIVGYDPEINGYHLKVSKMAKSI